MAQEATRRHAVIGKYRLIATLGHGGMADVYLALCQGPHGFHKLVVVKQLRPNLADDPEFLEMFLDEARVAARLNHPNVVQTNEVGDAAGEYFIAMEFLEGQSLAAVLRCAAARQLPFPLEAGIRILCDALRGLHHAHELCDYDGAPLSVVHRDASPQNIFVTYEGHTKLVDFGIAKAAMCTSETRPGMVKGKIGYMAPEQAMCRPVDRRADIFSVGAILWEMVCGRRLWSGLAELTVMERLAHGQLPRVRDVCGDIPDELEAICTKAMAFDPEDRYSTALDLADDLERYAAKHLPPVSPRELGALVAELFAARRQKLKELVEGQLRGISMAAKQAVGAADTFGPMTSSMERDGSNPSTTIPTETKTRSLSGLRAQRSRRGRALLAAVAGALVASGTLGLVQEHRPWASPLRAPAVTELAVHAGPRFSQVATTVASRASEPARVAPEATARPIEASPPPRAVPAKAARPPVRRPRVASRASDDPYHSLDRTDPWAD